MSKKPIVRSDKKKTMAKGLKIIKDNPFISQRCLAKLAGIGLGSANRVLKYLDEDGTLDGIRTEREEKQKILSNDIKSSIDDKLLTEFIILCGSKIKATKEIENFIKLSLGGGKMRRGYISKETRYDVLYKYGFKCCACGEKPTRNNNVILHIDHIIPHSLGGLDVENNLQVLCDKCNISKKNFYSVRH